MDVPTRRAAGPLLLLATLLVLVLDHLRAESPRLAPVPAYTDPTTATAPARLSGAFVPVIRSPTPGPSLPTPTPLFADIVDAPVDRATQHIDLIERSGIYLAELDLLASDLQVALNYVSERVGIRPAQRIRVLITRDASCSFHAATYSLIRIIQIFSCDSIPLRRVVNIAAHEFVHQLAQDEYSLDHLRADMILMEGFATWGAGSYWLGSRSSFSEFARDYRAAGYDIPLASDYRSAGGIDAMNALYYQWASFVDFLIATYGRERFDKLYISSNSRKPGSADYRGVYGKTLHVLEQEWQQFLNQ
ncbi:MAG: hypothetical protein KatS3mg057_2387 [Herpetosiphonaceae bacterium]|nr:MAG: hypothetical protein KatS3mg057_2387 [Herpetosiphonaceae bacterium]